jgi:hypothetical protein
MKRSREKTTGEGLKSTIIEESYNGDFTSILCLGRWWRLVLPLGFLSELPISGLIAESCIS